MELAAYQTLVYDDCPSFQVGMRSGQGRVAGYGLVAHCRVAQLPCFQGRVGHLTCFF